MQKLIFRTESMSQCHLKNEICMQKFFQIGRLLFLIISVCPNFLQLSILRKILNTSNSTFNHRRYFLSISFDLHKMVIDTILLNFCLTRFTIWSTILDFKIYRSTEVTRIKYRNQTLRRLHRIIQ